VLAKFLYSHSPTSVTIIYHFRASVDLDSARPAPFAAFVISRILQQPAIGTDPRLGLVRDSLDDLSNRFKDDSRKAPFATLWSALLALVELVPPFTIIIDGLDECHFSNSRELDDFLLKLEHLGAASKTRIIALSRPYGKFEPYVARATLIAMDAKLVDPDVIRFVDNQITMHRHLLPIRERILERVRDGCQGMFIWAILLLQYLQDGYTPNIKIRRLQEFPVELHSVYESIWTVASSRLDSETLQLRHEVLLILLAARRPLTIDEICVTLALRPLSPKIDTEDLPLDPHELLPTVCWPLAEILNGNLQLVHLSAKEFLTRNKRLTDTGNFAVHMSHDDSNSYLARKCLIRLLEAQNQSPNRIAPILRRNVYPESALTEEEDLFLETTVLYDYAAANWHIHLTAIPNPDTDILYLAQDFLHGNQFVMWGEYTFGKQQDNSPIAVVESRLKPWHSNLPPSSHEKIEINDFFTTPYRALSDTYKAEGNDKTLQWLCLFRLGGWYMMAPDFEAANKVKKEVVEGLTKLLGKSNPLTLRATASLAQNYLILGKMRLAAETYLETSQIQLEVVGADRPDSFESLMWAASAQYYLTEYSVSATNQSQAAAGFWRILGPTSTTFLMSQLFYGYALVGLGELDPALAILEDIYKRRSEILGPDNGMGLHAQVALASVLRKIGSLDKAELNLSQAYEARVRIWGISDMNSIDTSIHLIIIYREARKPAKAQEYIDALSKPGILEEYFERYCQVNHLHALLQIDAGNYKRSRDILRNLLDKSLRAGLGSNNRSLLWARLTLSTILREHGKKDEASELFEDLVETIKDTDCNSVDSLDGEPQPPRLLEIAEEALRLVRARKEREAKQLLEDNRLKWKREEDFWIMLGGPAADTAWMRGP
jgi:tetratricopeptide (TPR) repeat protein